MFAGTGEATIEKPEGRYALTMEQLSSSPAADRGFEDDAPELGQRSPIDGC